MGEIILNGIQKNENVMAYDFSVSEDLKPFFSEKALFIEYPEVIESVPNAVAAVPFVCNVLPIVWLTNSRLILEEIDKAFFECVANVKNGYETMFPESNFLGEIIVERIVASERDSRNGSAAFFSGGLDAVHTLITHLDERPALISIWGSDIRYDNVQGWELVHSGIAEYAQKYELPDVVIRSTFREFDNESVLHDAFSVQLKDSWWHGVKHGLALLGHAAPYAYLHGISKVYIASSYCPEDGLVRCASSPLTDNHVRYVNASVIHDGFEFSRQNKIQNVVNYCRETGEKVSLHVCWESQSGGNCCFCEKCYRTLLGILAEGGDPLNYGFEKAEEAISVSQDVLIGQRRLDKATSNTYWVHVHDRIIRNKTSLEQTRYWKSIRWITKADFTRLETVKMPLHYRIRRHLSQYRFYQVLHRIKEKL